MLLFTGMRIGELVNLEWEDIDFERRRIIVRPKEFWKPKGMEERMIPMHPAIFQSLANKTRISSWALIKQDGEQINVHSLETKFRKQLGGLGIKNANLHTWRNRCQDQTMLHQSKSSLFYSHQIEHEGVHESQLLPALETSGRASMPRLHSFQ